MVSFGLVSCTPLAGGSTAPVVQVDTGQLRGARVDEVYAFKGIPFAQPPIAELRWRSPQPAQAPSPAEAPASHEDCCEAALDAPMLPGSATSASLAVLALPAAIAPAKRVAAWTSDRPLAVHRGAPPPDILLLKSTLLL